MPVWPKDLSDRSREGRLKLIAVIERELRRERRRGASGNRAYDIARHAHLVQLLRQERAEFSVFERSGLTALAKRFSTFTKPM
ncbi:MAG: hypothetical protein QM780_06310 [Hyphomicrobium sp.]|uniref:hypothetical protein n=1 Tax=Hyphomicrobium sp. TaxID=82 RepID=UPI0039E33D1B